VDFLASDQLVGAKPIAGCVTGSVSDDGLVGEGSPMHVVATTVEPMPLDVSVGSSPSCVLATPVAGVMESTKKVCPSFDTNNVNFFEVFSTLLSPCQASAAVVTTGLREPSMEDVIAFGGIPCADKTEVRSSSRLREQPDADDTLMARAMKITQQRHDVYSAGIPSPPKFSFTSLSHSDIVVRASSIGVSLGKTLDETIKTVTLLKSTEEERMLNILKKNIDENMKEDAGPSTLLVSNMSSLCEDLMEDEVDGFSDTVREQPCPSPIVNIRKTRQHKVYDLSKLRRSTRKKFPKVY
jgi:hypothetical protein